MTKEEMLVQLDKLKGYCGSIPCDDCPFCLCKEYRLDDGYVFFCFVLYKTHYYGKFGESDEIAVELLQRFKMQKLKELSE